MSSDEIDALRRVLVRGQLIVLAAGALVLISGDAFDDGVQRAYLLRHLAFAPVIAAVVVVASRMPRLRGIRCWAAGWAVLAAEGLAIACVPLPGALPLAEALRIAAAFAPLGGVALLMMLHLGGAQSDDGRSR